MVELSLIVLLFGFQVKSKIIELFSAKSAEYFYHKKTSLMALSITQKWLSFRCLLLALLLVCVNSYTLEGPWQLQPEYLNYTKQNPDVSFTFQGFLPTIGRVPAEDTLGGASFSTAYVGNKQVIIHACKRLLYNYYVNESSIYLQYSKTLESIRQCKQNELSELMGKVNATFYFDIAADKLILYYPSSETALTLKRIDKGSLTPPPNTYEEWRLTKLRGQTVSEPQKSIYFSSDSIYTCDMQSIFRYTITQRNNIRTAQITGNCSNQTSTDIARSAYFYQMDGRRMNIYDSGLNEVGELEFIKSVDENELQKLKAAAEAVRNKAEEGVVVVNGGKNTYGGGIIPINTNINGVSQANNQGNPSNNIVIPAINIITPTTNTDPSTINTTLSTINNVPPTNTNPIIPNLNTNNVLQTTVTSNASLNANSSNTNTVTPATNSVPTSTNIIPSVVNPVNTNTTPLSINNVPPTVNSVPSSTNNPTLSANTTNPSNITVHSTSNTNPSSTAPIVPSTNAISPSTIVTPSNLNTPSINNVPPITNIPPANTNPTTNNIINTSNSSSSSSVKPKYSNTLKAPSPSNKSDCHCTPISTSDELTPFPPSLLQNKWYLYSINGTTHNIQAFYYYFLIITPQRMIYYGGCEVKWSNFQLDKNTLSNLKTFNSNKTSCLTPNLDESVLQPFYDSVKYINHAIISGVPYITFYDKDYQHVATFNTISPNYPSTWS